MKLVNFKHRSGAICTGQLVDDLIIPVAQQPIDVLLGGDLSALPADVERPGISRDEVTLLSPVLNPPSVRDFMAFEEHVTTSFAALGRSVDPAWYDLPVFYFTNPAAVIGPDTPVPMAPGTCEWDFELELAAVISRPGSDLTPRAAADHIAGYTLLCDWSARDHQQAEMPVGLGPSKGKDTATTLGPALVTPDELLDRRDGKGFDIELTASVNGRTYSTGNWRTIYWSFPEMIAYASRGTTLRPGDVIGSGTVGTGCILELSLTHGTETYPYLAPGDRVELHADRLGTLNLEVATGAPVVPFAAAEPTRQRRE